MKTRARIHLFSWTLFSSMALVMQARAAEVKKGLPPAKVAISQNLDPCTPDEQCNSLTESANDLSRAGQHAAALSTYEKAYSLKPAAWLLVNIGRVQQKMGRPKEAIASYQRFLESPAAESDVEMAMRARQFLKQAEQDLANPKRPMVIVMKEEREPRPTWRFVVGGTLIGLSIVGIGLGARALAVDGKCATPIEPPNQVCSWIYDNRPQGIGFLTAGIIVAAAGSVMMVLPGKLKPLPPANVALGGIGSGFGLQLAGAY